MYNLTSKQGGTWIFKTLMRCTEIDEGNAFFILVIKLRKINFFILVLILNET